MADIKYPLDLPLGPGEDEEDVCRVCRVEGGEDEPLIYPCKCSGSVRFVHPDCLKSWLAHSQKRYCEICGHRYTFTKVYPDYIPPIIPKAVYVRQSILWLYRLTCHALRFWMVVLAWLIVLPSLNMITLRSLVWLADSMAYSGTKIENGTLQNGASYISPVNPTYTTTVTVPSDAPSNATSNATGSDDHLHLADFILRLVNLMLTLGRTSWKNWSKSWYTGEENTLPGFVFRGQILSLVLAAVLVGLILLREWITQHNWAEHFPQPVEEEGEIDPDEWVVKHGTAQKLQDVIRQTKSKAESAALKAELMRMQIETSRWRRANSEQLGGETDIPRPRIPHRTTEPVSATPFLPRSHSNPFSLTESEEETPDASSSTSIPKIQTRRSSWPRSSSSPIRDRPTYPGRSPLSPNDTSPLPMLLDGSTFDPNLFPSVPLTSPGLPRPAGLPNAKSSVAYTAPELLDPKGKGKAIDLIEIADGGNGVTPSSSGSPEVIGMREVSEGKNTETSERDSFPHKQPTNHTYGDIPIILPRPHVNEESTAGTLDEPASPSADSEDTLPPRADTPMPPATRYAEDPTIADALLNEHIEVINGDAPEVEAAQPPNGDAEAEAEMDADADANGEGLLGEEDLDDGNWEREDWDGILEVVGLIGPINNLFQNVLFAIIIMGAALTILVGTPIIVGKVFLSLDLVSSFLSLSRVLLQLARMVTDPLVDVCLEITKDVVLLPLFSSVQALESIIARKFGFTLTRPASVNYSIPGVSTLLAGNERGETKLGDFFDIIGQTAYDLYEAQRGVCLQLATSDQLADRVWCMFVGYGVAVVTVGMIALAGEANLGRVSIGVIEQLKQHGVFLKLTFFMGFELIAFPIVIGAGIDICTIPLFEGATIWGRMEHLRNAPFAAIFVGWLVGTFFMFSFATFLSHIRSSCRAGALFFIRDPADQSYSPVKDIIERPSASQVRKLAMSAIMYTVVVVCLFGVACWGLVAQSFVPILPLRLGSIPPLSSVPFDLLFVHLVIPPSFDWLRPRHRVKKFWNTYWRITTRQLCLSSLMYGRDRRGRSATDEKKAGGPRVLEAMWPILDPVFQLAFGRYDPTATDARVPAEDQVALLPQSERRKGGVFVALDENGSPRTPEDKLRLLKQDKRAREAKRDPKNDYTVVWLPQYWRTRVHAFIFAALGMAATCLAILFFGPLVVGRAALAMLTTEPIHDGYSLVAGAYICVFAAFTGRMVGRRIAKLALAGQKRKSDASTRIKRVLLASLVNVYSVMMLYLVLPSGVGLLFELYVGVPGRYGLDHEAVPVIHFWDAWSTGTILDSLFVGMMGVVRRQHGGDVRERSRMERVREALRFPLRNNFHALNATFMPILGTMMIPVVLPVLPTTVTLLIRWHTGHSDQANGVIFRMMHPFTLIFILIVLFRRAAMNRIGAIRQQMIDAEYVVEERVENYDPTKEGVVEVEDVHVNGVREGGADGEGGGDGDGEGGGGQVHEEEEGEWVDEDEGVVEA